MTTGKISQEKGQSDTSSFQSNCMSNNIFFGNNSGMTQSYPMMSQQQHSQSKELFNINLPIFNASNSLPEKMQEEVLTTVTNSFNTTPAIFNFFPNNELKKLGSMGNFGGVSNNGQFSGLSSNSVCSGANKKENDKKKWLKRI